MNTSFPAAAGKHRATYGGGRRSCASPGACLTTAGCHLRGHGRFAVSGAPGRYTVTGGSESGSPCSTPIEITVEDHGVAGVAAHRAIP
ncbi:MAG: hypothetical protein JWO22_2965 [Frankiales bacterium]|nr:hypothetical protein [Frankiales bacterium]